MHDYLDDGLLKISSGEENFEQEKEENIFLETFSLLNNTIGKDIFKRWYGNEKCFKGQFLVSAYQTIVVGVSKHLETITQIENQSKWILEKIEQLWQNDKYVKYLTEGTRGAMQLTKLLPTDFFRP